ncbi:hypothetical protein TorRG33x02_077020 [Trema orientale]|uniref:Uncharacterized protein n=1 Tax=Trema orientale TaxID=63057 RepID=A0A2P5FF70_TREOI|nr:hypothetical protein TorRG33x02_077020 [Trema orientale]
MDLAFIKYYRGNEEIYHLRDGELVFSAFMASDLVSSALVANRTRKRRMMLYENHHRKSAFWPKTTPVFPVVLDEAAMIEYRQVLVYFSVSNMKSLPL